jgi:hypothetical protein
MKAIRRRLTAIFGLGLAVGVAGCGGTSDHVGQAITTTTVAPAVAAAEVQYLTQVQFVFEPLLPGENSAARLPDPHYVPSIAAGLSIGRLVCGSLAKAPTIVTFTNAYYRVEEAVASWGANRASAPSLASQVVTDAANYLCYNEEEQIDRLVDVFAAETSSKKIPGSPPGWAH